MSAEAAKIGAVAVAAAAPGAVAMSVEAAEVVEAVDAEQAFGRLERLYAQLPAMEEKGAALARARSAAEVDGLAKAAAYRAAELVRAEAFVREVEAALARSEAAGGDAAEKAAHLGDLRLALMAAGTQRGLKVGPAQNAEHALAQALEASPFDTVEEARVALLPADSLAALSAEVQAYQADYAEALAVCQQLEDGEESAGLPQSATS